MLQKFLRALEQSLPPSLMLPSLTIQILQSTRRLLVRQRHLSHQCRHTAAFFGISRVDPTNEKEHYGKEKEYSCHGFGSSASCHVLELETQCNFKFCEVDNDSETGEYTDSIGDGRPPKSQKQSKGGGQREGFSSFFALPASPYCLYVHVEDIFILDL